MREVTTSFSNMRDGLRAGPGRHADLDFLGRESRQRQHADRGREAEGLNCLLS